MFDLAKQLISADHVVIGAPYWDLSFPARLKIYLERCSVDKLTFLYDENGKIAEHWDVMETIADKSTWQNQNGKF